MTMPDSGIPSVSAPSSTMTKPGWSITITGIIRPHWEGGSQEIR